MFVNAQTCSTLIFLMSLVGSCVCQYVNYDRYSVLRITPTTKEQLISYINFHDKHAGELQYWMRTSNVNQSADVMVTPTFKMSLIRHLNSLRMPYRILIADVGKKIQEERVSPEQRAKLGFFEAYQSFEEIDQYFHNLAYKFPECVSLMPIGMSYEGRQLQVVRISSNPSMMKPAVWIQGGLHAREPIGPSTAVYIATQLACLCGKESEEKYELLNSFDWYFLPIANPDGYEYSQNVDRLWRKTRSCHPNPQNCIGVDPNRNWDVKWSDASGASLKPCSNYYAGPAPFSEPETKAVSQFMLYHLKGRLMLYIDLHTYSQRLSTPYGYTRQLPLNYPEQNRLAEVAIQAIKLVNGTQYTTGTTDNIVYTITGSARDWVFNEICPKYAYVIELRDKGEFGFLLPRRLILPTAAETWEGVKAMGLDMAGNLYSGYDYMK